MLQRLWRADRLIGLFTVVLILVAVAFGWLQGLERLLYDAGMRAASVKADDRVVVLAIDERALANLGRWPWPRDTQAKLVKQLKHARAVGLTVFFVEPDRDPGLALVTQLDQQLKRSALARLPADPALADARADVTKLTSLLEDALADLDRDALLAQAMAEAGNVFLPLPVEIGQPRERVDPSLPDWMQSSLISLAPSPATRALPVRKLLPPIDTLGERAAGIGHLSSTLDADGGVRTESLLLVHGGQLIPSLSLLLAARTMNLTPHDIRFSDDTVLQLGKQTLQVDQNYRLLNRYYPRTDQFAGFAVESVFDVISGKINVEQLAGKLVLVGPTAAGLGDRLVTPIDPLMTPVIKLAHTVSTLLGGDEIRVPTWASAARLLALALVCAYLVWLLPILSARASMCVSLVSAVALVVAAYAAMAVSGLWIQLALPAAALIAGHVLISSWRYFVTERRQVDTLRASVESNRQLALSFQERGQLDQSFETFKRCPMDDDLAGALYAVGLDFERKRQFSKAANVFEHIREFDPTFRDVAARVTTMRDMETNVMLSGTSAHSSSLVIGPDGKVAKPVLGRYTIDEELGKGAMGVVYLGHDPKIARVVAIKTLEFGAGFEDEQREEIRQRFFREAQAAGRLRHPNIVTIYDAGEEHDLAFIAMEVLSGKPLNAYTKPDALLPPDTAVAIIEQCALALHYAHQQNIVHRDIKPGNIMFDEDTGEVKITDFGIARIVDASRTRTGTVMGTPSYMSPEQLTGEKIDGRSDLFSLGVSLYLLLTGRWPFRADSLTKLMYKISQEPHPDIRELCPTLPYVDVLSEIVDTVLQKNPDDRYPTGEAFATALNQYLGLIETPASVDRIA